MDAAARVTARLDELVALAARLDRERAGVVEASRESNADDEHDPEGATIGFERAQLDATIFSTQRQIGELRTALVRIADGSYGICAVCGEPIPAARLEVRPSATTCVRHAGG